MYTDYFIAKLKAIFDDIVADTKLSKEDKLKQFVDLFTGIQQRDATWYSLIGTTIGGSEIATLLGKNKYQTRKKLIDNKVAIRMGINTFNSVAATRWGTMMEDVLGFYVEDTFDSNIYGDSICIQIYIGHRNSPDGYIVVKLYDANLYWNACPLALPDAANAAINAKYGTTAAWAIWTTDLTYIDPTHDAIVILEFKCPHSRKPAPIPEHYMTQVLSGLDVSPIAEFGLFADACFCKCKLSDLDYNDRYDKYYHKRQYDGVRPLAIGIIGVFGDTTVFKEDFDFGITGGSFDIMLELLEARKIFIKRARPSDRIGCLKILESWRKEEHYIGFVSWKMFEVQYSLVDREPNFIKRIYPAIADFHEAVQCALLKAQNYKTSEQTEYEEVTIAALKAHIS